MAAVDIKLKKKRQTNDKNYTFLSGNIYVEFSSHLLVTRTSDLILAHYQL